MSKIIVHIDDDRFLLNMYDIKLRRAGYEVYSFQTFDQNIIEEIARLKPDVIVSDIVHDSKDPDGIELCRQMQKDERLKDVPFIFLSNTLSLLKNEDVTDLKIALEIEKASFQPDEVVSQILRILNID
jgi:DNA-binding response OmpR family regulator